MADGKGGKGSLKSGRDAGERATATNPSRRRGVSN